MPNDADIEDTQSSSPRSNPPPLRPALTAEYQRAWQRLASAGTWWRGDERLAIAAEARRATDCSLCRERKAALSPYSLNSQHDSPYQLPTTLVDTIHRVRSDAARLTPSWLQSVLASGEFSEEQYVEAVGVIAIISALDKLDQALGVAQRPLPLPQPGEPTRQRPTGARAGLAWVAAVEPQDLEPHDPDPYTKHGHKNIHRALSLVPQEVINFFDLDVELYLKDHEIRDFDTEYRALNHAQIELTAARVSALNGCYY